MQANLFKILAIAAAFSTVQSAPIETSEGQVTQGQVNGTQVNGTQANEAHTNEAHVDDGIRLLRSSKSAIGRKFLISAQDRGREIFSRGLAGIIPATQSLSVSNGDVVNAIFTLTCVATHTRDAISVWPKDSLLCMEEKHGHGYGIIRGTTSIY
ncbi:hypothetical protein F4859DRAFT_510778 [Xylaria cf. heliscus]|nr:hypothetical protein F4859DRAFT_510778 [Xylaria cf. heliscus]